MSNVSANPRRPANARETMPSTNHRNEQTKNRRMRVGVHGFGGSNPPRFGGTLIHFGRRLHVTNADGTTWFKSRGRGFESHRLHSRGADILVCHLKLQPRGAV